MKGYKVFNPDWTCRGFKYEVGQIYTIDTTPVLCKNGFHFCKNLADCFNYYNFNSKNKVAAIEALGEIVHDGNKSCTNKIKILYELNWHEVLDMVNTGDYNTGNCNTGYYNTGNRNTGNRNTGDYNTGDYNTGDYNTGNCNTGDYNTGNCNTGDYNTGYYNTGDYNTGDYNTGCFNTLSPQLYFFDQPADITFDVWWNSDAYRLLSQVRPLQWINTADMTNEDKQTYPEHETTGGYLKYNPNAYQEWWDALDKNEKKIIKAIPNFDPVKFAKITKIKI